MKVSSLGVVLVLSTLACCRTTLADRSGDAGRVAISSRSNAPRAISGRMKAHDRFATTSRDAIVRGDLGEARRAASSLAEIRTEEALDVDRNRRLTAINDRRRE
jgi:hypothetical protein